MVDTVSSQTLIDGPRKVVMKFTNLSDGTGESAVKKVDVSELESFQGKTCTGVAIEKIDYSVSGMTATLLWDATTDVRIVDLATDGCLVAPLWNNAGTGKTGDVLLTTSGHSSGDSYSIILTMNKKYD